MTEKRALKTIAKEENEKMTDEEKKKTVNPLEEEGLLILDLTLDNIIKIQLESVKTLAEFSAKCVEQLKLVIMHCAENSNLEVKPINPGESTTSDEKNKLTYTINEQKLTNVELLQPVYDVRKLLIFLTNKIARIYDACTTAVKDLSSHGKTNLSALIPESKINDVKVAVEIDAKLKAANSNIYSESMSSINCFQEANLLSVPVFKYWMITKILE